MNQSIIFIVGPTAIGKSSLAIKLAKKIKAEIINADSMQVYKNLNVLTARPSKEDHNKVIHHLYGYIDGSQRYNVANWCNDVISILEKGKIKNKKYIIVGGTGMYVERILKGLKSIPTIPEKYKIRSQEIITKIGLENFYNIVKEFDPISIKKISKNDTNRLKRLWEVYNFTGIPFNKWKNKNTFFENKNYSIYLFLPSRKKIYENVNSRFLSMIKNGAIEEVRELFKMNYDKSLPIMRAHGVPEIINFLKNNITIEECVDKGQQVTRNYVKRQFTWWRSSTLKINKTFDVFPNELDLNLIKI